MGGGPDKEELLLTLPFPEDGFPLDELRTRHPDINVTYLEMSKDKPKDIDRTWSYIIHLKVDFQCLSSNKHD